MQKGRSIQLVIAYLVVKNSTDKISNQHSNPSINPAEIAAEDSIDHDMYLMITSWWEWEFGETNVHVRS